MALTPEQIAKMRPWMMTGSDVLIKPLRPDLVAPTRSARTEAANDVFMPQDYTFTPGEIVELDMGFACKVGRYQVGLFLSCHDLLRDHGIEVVHGQIDPWNWEEVKILVRCNNKEPVSFNKGERIARLLITSFTNRTPRVVDELIEDGT